MQCRVQGTLPSHASCSLRNNILSLVTDSRANHHSPCRQFPNVRLATQNIDRLHLRAGVDPRRVAEVHGALGVYRCTNLFAQLSPFPSIF